MTNHTKTQINSKIAQGYTHLTHTAGGKIVTWHKSQAGADRAAKGREVKPTDINNYLSGFGYNLAD